MTFCEDDSSSLSGYIKKIRLIYNSNVFSSVLLKLYNDDIETCFQYNDY